MALPILNRLGIFIERKPSKMAEVECGRARTREEEQRAQTRACAYEVQQRQQLQAAAAALSGKTAARCLPAGDPALEHQGALVGWTWAAAERGTKRGGVRTTWRELGVAISMQRA